MNSKSIKKLKCMVFRVVANANGCKVLDSNYNSNPFFIYVRNREKDLSYYKVFFKGNNFHAIKTQFVDSNDKPQSTFLNFVAAFVGAEPEKLKKKEIFHTKFPLAQWEAFLNDFVEKTPELSWHKDGDTYEDLEGNAVPCFWSFCEMIRDIKQDVENE